MLNPSIGNADWYYSHAGFDYIYQAARISILIISHSHRALAIPMNRGYQHRHHRIGLP
jgi:hypothetical protein